MVITLLLWSPITVLGPNKKQKYKKYSICANISPSG